MFYSLRAEQPQLLINEEVLKVGVSWVIHKIHNYFYCHLQLYTR